MAPSARPRHFARGLLFAVAALFLSGGNERADARPQESASKSLIYAGWYGNTIPTPSYIAENFGFLETLPFNGLVVYVRNPSLTINASQGVMSKVAISYAEISTALNPIKNLPFSRLRDNFAYVVGNSPPDFFDDWTIPIGNFANLARALKHAGLKGIFLDNEQYSFFTHWAEYPGAVAYPATPLDEYEAQARLRGKQVMEAMVAEFPGIVMLSLHGPYVSEPDAPWQLCFPEAIPQNALMGPFFSGFYQGRGASATIVDGGEFYGLRTASDFTGNALWRKNDFASDTVDCSFLPAADRVTWSSTIKVGFGVYDLPFGGIDMNPHIMTSTLRYALDNADRYAWFYTEGMTFLRPESQGGAPEVWVNAVRAVNFPGRDDSEESSSGCGLLGIEVIPLFLVLDRRRSKPRRLSP